MMKYYLTQWDEYDEVSSDHLTQWDEYDEVLSDPLGQVK